MRKFITSNFEIDLSAYRMSVVDENHWFNDQFFTKYSFPFDIHITDELNIAFGDILSDTSLNKKTFFEGKFVDGEVMEDATMEIEESNQEVASVIIRYGFEELPSFNTPLSELPLFYLEVEDMYVHAATVVDKTYPEVVYNFPQIHTEKIDTESPVWQYFQKKFNNYENGAFVENYIDLQTSIVYNLNIMQPLPYVLHLFKKGFEAAGLNLVGGSVLENPIFKKMLLFADVDYYTQFPTEAIDARVNSEENYQLSELKLDTNPNTLIGYYREMSVKKRIDITEKGRYRITGQIYFRPLWGKWHNYAIHYYYNEGYPNRITLAEGEVNANNLVNNYIDIDIIFDTLENAPVDYLELFMFSVYTSDTLVFDLEVTPIFYYDENYDPINIISNLDTVDLKRAVPSITFGELMKVYKNWYNIDFDLQGKNVYMNFIEDNINYKDAIDLSSYEVINRPRKYHSGLSFLLQFQDVDDDRFSYKKVFQNREEIRYSNIVTDEKTEEITIQALPLPNTDFDATDVNTAFAFEQNENKVFTVLYEGLNTSNLNLTEDPSPMFLPDVHRNHWTRWFDFRINADGNTWNFKAFREDVEGLKAKSKVFAFGRIMIVKNLTKDEIEEDLFEIEIEAHTLK